ncbi:hypothetical protein [Magnetospirillum fulvum]|uniref:Uncharacterized protein n=1 Tax=Magnetospirillum fulvum MGU-K5 TaxID=1316936 RepID=S9TED9_MAGFU|nr:hypothetical protein [Magnetospirillum fulvum]EPY00576.1 hypothetical protein K678_15364 [Magnetospirillum fulvum MGU-K5]
MPNIGFSAVAQGADAQSLFRSIRQTPIKEDVFARADPDAKRQYEDALDISKKLAQGAKDAQNFATTKDLEAKKERLKLLKMLAQSATDPRTIRAIAREVAEIARSLGNAAASGGGGSVTATATTATAVSADASGAVAASAATAGEGALTVSAQAAPAAATEAGAVAQTTAADGAKAAAPTEQAQSVATPGAPGGDNSIKDQVRELLQLAKKILEKLRSSVLPGTRESEEVEKANREVLKAAAAFGISLDDRSQSASPSDGAGAETSDVAAVASVTVVDVAEITSVDIKV